MVKKPEEHEEKELEFTPPQEDPYILMKQQYEFLIQRLDTVEGMINNLQTTWTRLLQIAQEQPPLQSPYQQPYQQPFQQQWQSPYQQQWQQPEQQFEQQFDDRPAWDKEPIEEKPEKKGKLTRGKTLMLIGVGILIMVAIWLRGQGWSCAIPGVG